ncbi:hypothetical protein F383_12069 [Gossypium arboreum]|uniref:Uncharacterized protein n=1 Tax=Gossypium arboreum TaxID=29729 RepID=A0A0B0NIC2_GOSAR|nr:hypothetical protein F383_12069 [Gossypium arboreum]
MLQHHIIRICTYLGTKMTIIEPNRCILYSSLDQDPVHVFLDL